MRRKKPLQYTGGKMLVVAPDGTLVGSVEEARSIEENFKPFSQSHKASMKSA